MRPHPPLRRFAIPLLLLICSTRARAAQIHLDNQTFTLPDGFTIELVAAPPVVQRPVVADFDELGRLYVADSSGSSDKVAKQLEDKPHRILRLDPANAAGVFERSSVFAEHMMFTEGTMWYRGALYAAAPPSIWRITDGGDRTEWFGGKTLTGCANDLHGPYLGPDGWIYWCKGAFAEQTYQLEGRKKPFVTRASHIFRCRPDGSHLEPVMTGGMDNPVDVVFTPGGERIFSCTFLQQPAGGHRDGLIHAIYGAVYGKVHDVIENHVHTSPDVMPPMTHLGPAAACGLTRYESDAFGAEYKDNLFACCFNLHKVTRHVLVPSGATFTTTDSDFLTSDNLDFHPTDVIEDADGSLLVVNTGGWYKLCCPTSQFHKPDILGAIYRIRRTGQLQLHDPRGLALDWAHLSADDLAPLLEAPAAIRKRGIDALALKGAEALPGLARALHARNDLPGDVPLGGHGTWHDAPLARLSAVWCATRIDDPRARELVRPALADPDETVRQAAAHSASVWRDRGAMQGLVRLLQSGTPQNRRVAAEALGRLGDASAVPALLAALEHPVDRALDHSLIYALIEIGDAKSTAAGLASAVPSVRGGAMVALDQMDDGGLQASAVAAELASADAGLRETAAWIASRHADWGAQVVAPLRARFAAQLSDADLASLEQQLGKLAHAPEVQELLAERLADGKAPLPQRRAVLRAMTNSGLKSLPPTWARAIEAVLADAGAAPLVPDAVACLRKLSSADKAAAASPDLQKLLLAAAARSDLPVASRLDAITSLPPNAPIPADTFAFLLSQLAPTEPASARLAAANAVARIKWPAAQRLQLIDALKTASPLEIERLLTAFDAGGDDALGLKLIAALQEAKALRTLRPDSLQRHLAKFSPKVKQEAEPLMTNLSPDLAQQRARLDQLLSTLPEGDVRRGQAVFNSAKTACATCHAMGYVGGNVGPDLTRIGAVRQKRDLLESILYPSASFVQSFEPWVVDTTDGDRLSGILRRNDAEEVMLVTGPNQEVRIPRAKVKEIKPGTVSVMPEGIDQQMTPQELGDLLAFLANCK
jgi:putative membrane-bound dehydrogenase-like protein